MESRASDSTLISVHRLIGVSIRGMSSCAEPAANVMAAARTSSSDNVGKSARIRPSWHPQRGSRVRSTVTSVELPPPLGPATAAGGRLAFPVSCLGGGWLWTRLRLRCAHAVASAEPRRGRSASLPVRGRDPRLRRHPSRVVRLSPARTDATRQRRRRLGPVRFRRQDLRPLLRVVRVARTLPGPPGRVGDHGSSIAVHRAAHPGGSGRCPSSRVTTCATF